MVARRAGTEEEATERQDPNREAAGEDRPLAEPDAVDMRFRSIAEAEEPVAAAWAAVLGPKVGKAE